VIVENPVDAGRALRGLLREARPSVGIVVEPDRYLRRRLSPIRLPRSRVAAMAELDLQSSTPFNVADFFLIVPEYDETSPESVYYTVKKSLLAPVLEGLRSARVAVSSLALAEADRTVAADRPSLREVVGHTAAATALRRAQAIGVGVLVLGIVTAVGMAHWRNAAAAAQVDAAIAAAETDVAELRALIAARDARVALIGAVTEDKNSAVPIASVLNEMAKVIPDSTWLTDISVNGTSVRFSGLSDSAVALIPVLEASPLFRSPTFMEPVVRAEGEQGQRFTIAMQIEASDG
jgi:general secretion pathway protein L